jgi:hypothetical protein
VDVVVLAGYDALGRPRMMNGFFADAGNSGWYGPAPRSGELTHLWVPLVPTAGRGVLLVSQRATQVQVGSTMYEASSGVLDIAADGSEAVVVRAGDGVLYRGEMQAEIPDDPVGGDVLDWPTRGIPAPRRVVQAAVAATLERGGVLPTPERQLASGQLPDGRVYYAFTAGATGTDSGRTGWFWVGAADGSAGELTEIESLRAGHNPNLLAWNVDGYVVFIAQPGVRSVEYTTDDGATYRPAPHVDGVGTLDVRGIEVTDAGEVQVRVVDFPGCATYTWTLGQGGITGEICGKYSDRYPD